MGLDTLANGLRSGSQPNGVIETTTTKEKWLVQKFGGTSVGKYPLNIVDNVIRRAISLIRCELIDLTFLQTESITWQSCGCLLRAK